MTSHDFAGSAPRVSVIIATYNMGAHLAEAVASVLAQTVADLELIIVDDGSTDDKSEVLSRLPEDARIKVVRQDNQGQPNAKNAGLDQATGRFIAFCDADDFWRPNKLELQLPRFEDAPRTGVVFSPAVALHADGRREPLKGPRYLRGNVLEAMFLHNIVPFGTAVVRRECLDDVGGFDESIPMGIDWELWLRIALDWEFDFVPELTYVYRIWDGQMSKNWCGQYECALLIMSRFLQQHPDRVPRSVVATAYADTYSNLAYSELQNVGMRACLQSLLCALRYQPAFRPAWRMLLLMPWHRFKALKS